MKKCLVCEKELKDTELVCPKCGERVEAVDLNKIKVPEPIKKMPPLFDKDCEICQKEAKTDPLKKYDDGKLLEKFNSAKRMIEKYQDEKGQLEDDLRRTDNEREFLANKITDLNIILEGLENVK